MEVYPKVLNETTVEISATVKNPRADRAWKMEALAAVSTGLLTVWDMTKQYEKDADGQYPSTAIQDIHVVRKFKQAWLYEWNFKTAQRASTKKTQLSQFTFAAPHDTTKWLRVKNVSDLGGDTIQNLIQAAGTQHNLQENYFRR